MRKIIHIDMDAFYASVEIRDRPYLADKPIVVGGLPSTRSVVCTCNYIAREYGIRSAMPCSQAYKLCPQAIFVPVQMSKYKVESDKIHQIFHTKTDLIEPLSLDEAYLDVTNSCNTIEDAVKVAEDIRKKIFKETKLTASAGVSYNKFIAKIASDINKPDGLFKIDENEAIPFLKSLPIGKFYGVGKKSEEKFKSIGILKGSDLFEYTEQELISRFGKMGSYYYNVVRGIDNRKVVTERVAKSIGREETFRDDIIDKVKILDEIRKLAIRVEKDLERNNRSGKTITLKVKYSNFKQITRSVTIDRYIYNSDDIYKNIETLFHKTDIGIKPIRLVGVSISSLDGEKHAIQQELF